MDLFIEHFGHILKRNPHKLPITFDQRYAPIQQPNQYVYERPYSHYTSDEEDYIETQVTAEPMELEYTNSPNPWDYHNSDNKNDNNDLGWGALNPIN